MDQGSLTRRQILKLSSLAALSSIAKPFSAMSAGLPEQVDLSLAITSANEVCFMNAVDLLSMLRAKKISAREVMQEHLKQIAKVNSKVNAIVTMPPEDQLMAQALAADEAIAHGKMLGPLHGLPLGVKDLMDTKGLRTTQGSTIYKDFIPTQDALIVEREKKAGAIIIGKTNVPEFGLGSQTFNPVFGASFNPYDVTKTCGGSTGGGAVALACGMIPLSDGSDMGGSLRNPASFCNVVGLRPSPGRVPLGGAKFAWAGLAVQGPMARTVSDCALLLSVQAGPDSRSPISIMEDPRQFNVPLARNFKGVRVAFIKDLGLPFEKEVKDAFDAQRKIFESLGCIVEEAEPDFTDANECFVNQRHWYNEAAYADQLKAHPDEMNDYVKWHVAEGQKLTGPYLARLENKRSLLFRRVQQFFKEYEFLIMPVSQVLPFDVKQPFPTEINGVKMENYIDWMRSSYYISAVGNPAISVPSAFSKSGLPVGIQIVGKHNADLSVLQMGYAFEQATNIGKRRPGVIN